MRFVFLSKIPPELNRDEVSVGFNAYSLLETGKDEHGRGPWPLVFRAFGDNKIPGYIYLTAPLVRVFGLNAFTVRLPAAFFGWLTILVFYFFGGTRDFNPLAVVFRPFRLAKVFRFWSAFKDYKHGKVEVIEKLADDLLEYADVVERKDA